MRTARIPRPGSAPKSFDDGLARRFLARCAFALLLGFSGAALAAPRAVFPFTAETWRQLAHSPARPLAVVFSTTDCAHCPKAIDTLAQALRGTRAQLAVVVMDGAGSEKALRTDPHYRRANALYVFAGDAVALRYAVNPDWRGLTPYVALIPKTGSMRFHAGTPPAEALQGFLHP